MSSACLLQFAVLAALSLQNTSAILINSAVMKPPKDDLVMWNPQTGVIYQEVFKIITSLCLLLAGGEHLSAVLANGYEIMRSGVPGLCYLLVNNLTYVAMAHLDPAVFAVTQKLRILFAAMLTVFLLGTEVGCFRWAALVFLCVGVGCVQFAMEVPGRVQAEGDALDEVRGLTATLGASFISALAGVYCEKILKDSDISLWVRNVHFSAYGCFLGVAGLGLTGELGQVFSGGLFAGYRPLTWVAVANNGVGGILVSLAIKHVDVVASNFSQTVALVLISLFSVLVLGRDANGFFVLGVAVVCSATLVYAINPSPPALRSCAAKMPAQANGRTLVIAFVTTGVCIFAARSMLSIGATPWESPWLEELPTPQSDIILTEFDLGPFSLAESTLGAPGASTQDKVRLRGSDPSLASLPST